MALTGTVATLAPLTGFVLWPNRAHQAATAGAAGLWEEQFKMAKQEDTE